jgi:hypothetical protein
MEATPYELEQLRMQLLMAQGGDQPRIPTFPGSVLYGLTQGWKGTAPETMPQYAGAFLGGVIPAVGIGALTEGLGAPAAIARALSLGKAGHTAARGALTGGILGASFGKDESPPERIANALLGAVTGGALDYGLARYKLGKLPKAPVKETLPDQLPQGYTDPAYKPVQDLVAKTGTKMPVGAGASFSYPEGTGSLLGEGMQQLDLPMLSTQSLKAQAVPGSVEVAIHKNPSKTLEWLQQEAKSKGLYLDYTKKPDAAGNRVNMYDMLKSGPSNMGFKTIDDAFSHIVKTRGLLTEGPDPFEVRNLMSGQSSRFKDLGSAQKHLRNELFSNMSGGESGQFKLFGDPIDEAMTRTAHTKGFTIYEQPNGITAVGMGGRVEKFKDVRDLHVFLQLQKELPLPPSVAYGTFDKIANRLPLDKVDYASIAATKSIFNKPPVTMGHTVMEPIRDLGGRERVNVVKGITNQEDFTRVIGDLQKKGLEYKVLDLGDNTQDVLYYKKWTRTERDATRLWAQYRVSGVGKLTFDDQRFLGFAFGKTPGEISQWTMNNSAFAALEGKTRTMLLDQVRFPQFHKSPLVAGISRLVHGSYMTVTNDLSQIAEEVTPIFAKLSQPERVAAFRAVEGRIPFQDLSENAQNAVGVYRKWMRSLAEDMKLKPYKEYATHITDMDAMWGAFHKDIAMNDFKSAPEALRKKLTENDYNRIRGIALNPRFVPKPGQEIWRTLGREDQGFIKSKLFDWEDVAKTMDQLPAYVRGLVPTELFNPYLIPREKGVRIPYKEDIVEVFNKYTTRMVHDIHFRPLLEDPVFNLQGKSMSIPQVINSLPGAGASGSERNYLERYMARVITGRPDSFSTMLRNITDNMNETLGTSIVDTNFLNDVITMYRGAMYRGLLGPDSAIQNMTQILNNIALNGRYVAPAFKSYVFGSKRPPRMQGVVDDLIDFTENIPSSDKGLMKKALDFSDFLNRKLLYPMHATELINRGIGWFAGMEEAAILGMGSKDALRLSMGKVSGIKQPLALTEQQYHALLTVMKTQFGYDVAQQPPFASNPLYRLSTLFVSYPMRQAEFMQREIGAAVNGYFAAMKTMGPAAAFDVADKGKLMRFLALTGFMFSAPYAIGQLGLDVSNIWGKGAMPFSLPFYKTLIDGYNAVVGDNPESRHSAQSKVMDAFTSVAIPQYRYMKKASSVNENIQRGFSTDSKGRFVHETSTIGELLRLFGVGPEEYKNKRLLAEQWHEVGSEYAFSKREALESLVLKNEMGPAQDFMKKWGRPITPKDVENYIATLKKTPQERAVSGLPNDVIMNQIAQKPYLNPAGF